MKQISHREYLDKLRYINDKWNEPSRSDYYSMQIAQRVDGVLSKRVPKLENFKIPFEVTEQKKRVSKEQASVWSKSFWLPLLGMGKKGKKQKFRVRKSDGTIEEGD